MQKEVEGNERGAGEGTNEGEKVEGWSVRGGRRRGREGKGLRGKEG